MRSPALRKAGPAILLHAWAIFRLRREKRNLRVPPLQAADKYCIVEENT